MGVAYGINPTWAAQTDAGRTHIATKGIVQSGLVLNLDAGVSSSYDKYENLFTYSGLPQSSNTAFPTGWDGWNPATFLKSQTLSPNGVDYGVFHGAINQNGGGIRKDLTGLSANTTYTVSFWGKKITQNELTYFTNNNARGTTTGTADGAQNVAWFIATKCSVEIQNITGTGASGSAIFSLSETWTRFSTQLTTDTAGSIRIIIANNVSDVGTGNEDGGGTWMIWGAQLEKGSSVTDYYATTSSVKNRGTTLIDLSGQGNTGTLTNGPTYSSANGGSIVFDGVDDKVTFPNNTISTSSGMTVEVWFKTSSGTKYQDIFDLDDAYGVWIVTNYLGQIGKIHTSFNTISGYMTADYSVNTWYQVVLSGSGTSNFMHLNGVQVSTGTQIVRSSINLNTARIGNVDGDRAAEYLVGNVASLKIYNRALTASEILQNYDALKGRFA